MPILLHISIEEQFPFLENYSYQEILTWIRLKIGLLINSTNWYTFAQILHLSFKKTNKQTKPSLAYQEEIPSYIEK